MSCRGLFVMTKRNWFFFFFLWLTNLEVFRPRWCWQGWQVVEKISSLRESCSHKFEVDAFISIFEKLTLNALPVCMSWKGRKCDSGRNHILTKLSSKYEKIYCCVSLMWKIRDFLYSIIVATNDMPSKNVASNYIDVGECWVAYVLCTRWFSEGILAVLILFSWLSEVERIWTWHSIYYDYLNNEFEISWFGCRVVILFKWALPFSGNFFVLSFFPVTWLIWWNSVQSVKLRCIYCIWTAIFPIGITINAKKIIIHFFWSNDVLVPSSAKSVKEIGVECLLGIVAVHVNLARPIDIEFWEIGLTISYVC